MAAMSLARIHLVTGFLGAGKSTLLRHLLDQGLGGERVAVLVNEFGEVGIDGGMLRRGGHEVVELASGCICCEIGADMLDTVSTIIHEYAPQRLVFELSGLAEPGSVLAALTQTHFLVGKIRMEPTVCVVDAHAYRDLSGERMYNYYNQIQASDVVLLNKADLMDEAGLTEVEALLREDNPQAFMVRCVRCEVDPAVLFDPSLPRVGAAVPTGEIHHHNDFVSFVIQDPETTYDRGRVERWLQALPREVFRVKGTLRCREGSMFLNWVRSGCHWEAATESDAPPTTLVCIGRAIRSGEIEAAFRACVPRARRGIQISGPGLAE